VQHDGLYFLPLGGTGEIGMNLNLYHHAGRWLMVDCGVMFERTDLDQYALYPDARYIADRRDTLDGLVITHAHQDHVGAVRDLWPQLRCPVYATRFTVAMLRSALQEVGLHRKVPVHVVAQDARFQVGPFDLQRVPLTHSTVEMAGLVIRTPAGTVFHTGDFKLDPDPVEGRTSDERTLHALAHEDVLACISDSTNAHQEGWTRSEGEVARGLREVLADCPARIAVSLFSSNVARVRTLMLLARELGREVVLLGRSLQRTVQCAREAGYLAGLPEPVDAREFGFLPRDRVMLLCTGSQGEPRAALTRIAEDKRRDVYLETGDTAVFSARKIPGNELFVERIGRLLQALGVRVITAQDAFVHTSGHPRRQELRTLYDAIQPRGVVPVHGTPMHLEAHAQLARSMDLEAYEIRNGHMLRLSPGPVGVVGSVPTGRIRRQEQPREERRWEGKKKKRRRRRRKKGRMGWG